MYVLAADMGRIAPGLEWSIAEGQREYARRLTDDGVGMYRTHVDNGHHAEELTRDVELFGGDRLHIVWSDAFAQDSRARVAALPGFRGSDPAAAEGFDYPWMDVGRAPVEKWLFPDPEDRLRRHCRPHNRQLEQITGRDLSVWDEVRRADA